MNKNNYLLTKHPENINKVYAKKGMFDNVKNKLFQHQLFPLHISSSKTV